MKCQRCNSENVQMQSRPGKSFPIIGFAFSVALAFTGLGLMFFSIADVIVGLGSMYLFLSTAGAIVGFVASGFFGCILGAILKAFLPKKYETVAVCQNCGYTSEPIKQDLPKK